MGAILKFIARLLIKYLSGPSSSVNTVTTNSPELLRSALQVGDILLVEGKQRYSTAIKYLTQSNWSHAALYVGDGKLIEATLENGVHLAGIEFYEKFHTRICRPVDLKAEDLAKVIEYCKSKIGLAYDTKNILDLARYLFPTPPIPTKWRRTLLEFGSGNPSKVICTSMIASAFQKINYPILPIVQEHDGLVRYQARHHSLYTPSDFDRSPYFSVIKPTLVHGFAYRELHWI